MEDIKAKEYIRTKKGNIIKIIKEDVNYYILLGELNSKTITNPITKHSSDIFDIIEIGDYVNGEPVEQISEFEITTTTEYITNPKDIKSIVTKEQFENAEYKLDN